MKRTTALLLLFALCIVGTSIAEESDGKPGREHKGRGRGRGRGHVVLFKEKDSAEADCVALDSSNEKVQAEEAAHCCQEESYCCGGDSKQCTEDSATCGFRFICRKGRHGMGHHKRQWVPIVAGVGAFLLFALGGFFAWWRCCRPASVDHTDVETAAPGLHGAGNLQAWSKSQALSSQGVVMGDIVTASPHPAASLAYVANAGDADSVPRMP